MVKSEWGGDGRSPHSASPAAAGLLYVHKDTVRLVQHAAEGDAQPRYHLEFQFDADAPCTVTVHLLAKERLEGAGAGTFEAQRTLPSRRFGAGHRQTYFEPECVLEGLHELTPEQMAFSVETGVYPLVVDVEVDREAGLEKRHALSTYMMLEHVSSGVAAKVVVQKLGANGLSYVLREIFGIEPKAPAAEGDDGADAAAEDDEDAEDDNTECVVCMTNAKDTMALPCRHMCLCSGCAEVLRHQVNKCPICRAPFHSLLQVRVLIPEDVNYSDDESEDDDAAADSACSPPPGYKTVSLATMLNSKGGGTVAAAAAGAGVCSREEDEEDEEDDEDEEDGGGGYLSIGDGGADQHGHVRELPQLRHVAETSFGGAGGGDDSSLEQVQVLRATRAASPEPASLPGTPDTARSRGSGGARGHNL